MKVSAAIIGCGRIGCSFDDDPKRKIISTHVGAYEANNEILLIISLFFSEIILDC